MDSNAWYCALGKFALSSYDGIVSIFAIFAYSSHALMESFRFLFKMNSGSSSSSRSIDLRHRYKLYPPSAFYCYHCFYYSLFTHACLAQEAYQCDSCSLQLPSDDLSASTVPTRSPPPPMRPSPSKAKQITCPHCGAKFSPREHGKTSSITNPMIM